MASWAAKRDHNSSGKRKSALEIRAVGAGRNRGIGEVDERGPCNPEGEDVFFIMQPHVKVGFRSEGMGSLGTIV